jgi:hypothetical protein
MVDRRETNARLRKKGYAVDDDDQDADVIPISPGKPAETANTQ